MIVLPSSRTNDGRTNDGRTNDGRTNDGRTNDSAPLKIPPILLTFLFSIVTILKITDYITKLR